jgi:Holliday junction resolvasome RuvABC endonuclease subunit
MIVLGVDPGVSGALALNAGSWLETCKLDATERDIWDTLSRWNRGYSIDFACIERVHAMPKQGVSSSFTFGQSYGYLRGLLIASGIRFEEVTPRTWQKSLGCLSGGDKNVTKARAQQLFPTLKITHATADALLISEYAHRLAQSRRAAS